MERAVVLAVLLLGAACARASPAGFWQKFRSKEIVASHSDQGPWGGTRWIHWTAPEGGRFSTDTVSEFARKNGWKCEKPQFVPAVRMRGWIWAGKPVFPSWFFDTTPGVPIDFDKPQLLASDRFPRHVIDDAEIVRCDSGWIRTLGPSGGDEAAAGFILLERSGRRFAIYHIWGEI